MVRLAWWDSLTDEASSPHNPPLPKFEMVLALTPGWSEDHKAVQVFYYICSIIFESALCSVAWDGGHFTVCNVMCRDQSSYINKHSIILPVPRLSWSWAKRRARMNDAVSLSCISTNKRTFLNDANLSKKFVLFSIFHKF